MNIDFLFLDCLRTKTFPESLPNVQLWGPKHQSKDLNHISRNWKSNDIAAFYDFSNFL